MPRGSVFVCQSCGYQASRWMGQCPECLEWNSLVETIVSTTKSTQTKKRGKSLQISPSPLTAVKNNVQSRISTQIKEIDRVIGGGLLPGQVVLIGGEPGIGKSTLLLQLGGNFSVSDKNKRILYIAGEESPLQIRSRAERLGTKVEHIDVLDSFDADEIADYLRSADDTYSLVIVDSIQTITVSDLTGGAGSVGQVRESASRLSAAAKSLNIPLFLVGQVTKEGSIAGPKTLEHIVDTVLYLEGDQDHITRILRTTKNRFGSINEVGIFEMEARGIVPVENPAEVFLRERSVDSSGSVVTLVLEGSRVIAVEVQALVSKTSFGYPKRTSSGFSLNRLNLLIAVLEKRARVKLYNQDVYLNVASGLQLSEPAVDLAVCLAIISSLNDKVVPANVCAFGEVGLGGEIRKVPQITRRFEEAKNLGFNTMVAPGEYRNVRDLMKVIKSG